MKKHGANNERINRKYLMFLSQAKGQNEATLDSMAKVIRQKPVATIEQIQHMLSILPHKTPHGKT